MISLIQLFHIPNFVFTADMPSFDLGILGLNDIPLQPPQQTQAADPNPAYYRKSKRRQDIAFPVVLEKKNLQRRRNHLQQRKTVSNEAKPLCEGMKTSNKIVSKKSSLNRFVTIT